MICLRERKKGACLISSFSFQILGARYVELIVWLEFTDKTVYIGTSALCPFPWLHRLGAESLETRLFSHRRKGRYLSASQ